MTDDEGEDEEEIPFGRTLSYPTSGAPPLLAAAAYITIDEVKPAQAEEPYYWRPRRTWDEPDSERRCHRHDDQPGHGRSPDGDWVCTRTHGHGGPHIAQTYDGNIVAIWNERD